MDVCFYATLRKTVGGKRVSFDLPGGSTAGDLLRYASREFPALQPLIWEADGRLGDYIKVFVDGREIRHLQGLDTPVPAAATVDIFPPTAGG
jgi:molybdopterin synthase sulfur carrier subunit